MNGNGIRPHERARRFEVARGERVLYGPVLHPVRRAPRCRAGVELRHQVGLAPRELGLEQVAEEVVVPVPAAAVVERDDEQVRVLELCQRLGRVGAVEDRIAQRRGHPVEHRGPREELDVVRPQLGEVLRAQVVRHEPVVAAEARNGRGRATPGARARRGRAPRASLRRVRSACELRHRTPAPRRRRGASRPRCPTARARQARPRATRRLRGTGRTGARPRRARRARAATLPARSARVRRSRRSSANRSPRARRRGRGRSGSRPRRAPSRAAG